MTQLEAEKSDTKKAEEWQEVETDGGRMVSVRWGGGVGGAIKQGVGQKGTPARNREEHQELSNGDYLIVRSSYR